MLSVWFRPHHWAPGRSRAGLPLQVHFDLKDTLRAARGGDDRQHDRVPRAGPPRRRHHHAPVLRSVSEPKTTKLGTGRFWVIDVEYLNQRRRAGRRRVATPASATGEPSLPGPRRSPSTGWRSATRCPSCLRRHRDDRRARRARQPRLAADAPRPRLRGQPQRHAGHLPEHAEPGARGSSATHRLDGPEGPARPMKFRMKLGLPRRHDAVRRRRARGPSTRPAAAGSTLDLDRPRRRRDLHRMRRCGSRSRPTPDDNPWRAHGDDWRP